MGRHCHRRRRRYWTYNSTDDDAFYLPNEKSPLVITYYYSIIICNVYIVYKLYLCGTYTKVRCLKTKRIINDKSSANTFFLFSGYRVKETLVHGIFLCWMSVKVFVLILLLSIIPRKRRMTQWFRREGA